MPATTFYFDLGSPYAHLAAQRLDTPLPEPVRWQPVLLGGLFRLAGRRSWALGDDRRRETGMAAIERRARQHGLAPIRWPDPWPADHLFAMRAATFAFVLGLGREFARRAFRDAFERGTDLSSPGRVLEAGRQVGIDAGELEAAARDPRVSRALREATEAAHARGVIGVPTVAIGDELFWGDDRLEEAAAHLRSTMAA